MTLQEYELLDYDEKLSVVLTDGNYIAVRKSGYYIISLYRLYNFYVEAWFDCNKNGFEKIDLSTNTDNFIIEEISGAKIYRTIPSKI
jgi:hypothetical protein